jgi:hypothetical protein
VVLVPASTMAFADLLLKKLVVKLFQSVMHVHKNPLVQAKADRRQRWRGCRSCWGREIATPDGESGAAPQLSQLCGRWLIPAGGATFTQDTGRNRLSPEHLRPV